MRFYFPTFIIIATIVITDVVYFFFLNRLKHRNFYRKLQTASLFLSVLYLFVFSFLFLSEPLYYDSSAANFYRSMSWAITWFLVWYVPRLLMFFLYPFYRFLPLKNPKIALHRTMAFFSMLLFSGIFAASISMVHRYQNIKHSDIPKNFSGYRIVQISDLHLYSQTLSKPLWERRVDDINGLNPDLIVFTGDLVNNFWIETQGWDSVFSRLKARDGKFAVLGNHDYGDYTRWKTPHDKFINGQRIQQFLNRNGFRLVNNQHHCLIRMNDTLILAGIENWGNHPFPRYGDLSKALDGVQHHLPVILLSHDSDFWDAEAVNAPWNLILTLSGHTHGFQFGLQTRWFSFSPAQWRYKRWGGIYKSHGRYLYVSTGIGTIAYMGRVGILPEIVIFDLYRD